METVLSILLLISVLLLAAVLYIFLIKRRAVKKPVILIAAFGSSYPSGLSNLNDFDKAVVAAFPGHEVRWAFTASFVVKKLRKEGIDSVFDRKVPLHSLEEAFDALRADKVENVLVQSLHLMVGEKFRRVVHADSSALNVKFSYPLLFDTKRIGDIIATLEGEIADSEETATIFCAHGNEKFPAYNAELQNIDHYLRENYKNTYLAVIEGDPEFEAVKETVLSNSTRRVKFVSFMLTNGDHITNDVMGDEEDSMKSQLGLPAECSDGLASHPGIQKIFLSSMKSVMAYF